MKFLLSALLTLLVTQHLAAQQRTIQTVNDNWMFFPGDTMAKAQPVNIPHSWNKEDVMDDDPGYYRGTGWYKKTLYIPKSWNNKQVFLSFEGANQVTIVYVNGRKVGQHTGGYTAFHFNITAFLQFNNDDTPNNIVVEVNNSHDESIPPLSADFTFFGGIYRDIHLIATAPVHIGMGEKGENELFINTPNVSAEKANLRIRANISNQATTTQKLKITNQLFDSNNKLVAEKTEEINAKAGTKTNYTATIENIKKPHLWSPDEPYLYRIVTTISDQSNGTQLDQLVNAVGFRWYTFDANNGFFLNGKPYKLIGTNRHQDYKGMANALPDAMHVNDIRLLKAMGANYLRIAHYPQDNALMEACDRLGILASVEIPIVNRITESQEFTANCQHMLIEMIRQQYNHPSVILWAYMNEILLRARYDKDSPQQEQYFKAVTALAQSLDSMARKEDPSRPTMMAMNGTFDLYKRTGLAKIPAVTGWNLYNGWYSEGIAKFGEYLDRAHAELPDKPILVTEYGADALPQLRSFSPVRFDKSIDYENYFHQVYLNEIQKRTFVAGANVWNLADFSAESRAEAMPHVNNKGLLSWERIPKDVYYYYQARLLKTPFIKIGSGNWKLRSGIAGANLSCTQPVEIYSNQSEVNLYLNGIPLGTKKTEQGVARFEVPFVNGNNQLEAVTAGNAQPVKDLADIRFLLLPARLKDTVPAFEEINISLGDRRYYTDEKLQQVWLPEQPYTPGSWGYIGGEIFAMKGVKRVSYGSDKDILGTDYDAIYETQRTGIEGFKLDVPDGQYEITLHMCELLSNATKEVLANNLSNERQQETAIERNFDIIINNHKAIENLGSHNYLVPERAYAVKTKCWVANGKGISIQFVTHKGKAILNGIQVRKID